MSLRHKNKNKSVKRGKEERTTQKQNNGSYHHNSTSEATKLNSQFAEYVGGVA